MSRCLYCYKELGAEEHDFHAACARKFFGTAEAPIMEYTRAEMDALAEKIIRSQTTLTGVQPKLSLNLLQHEGSQRLTIVGLWGYYIFKPQTDNYPELPENEDLTMHLAEIAKIKTAQHCLIRLADQSLGYLTKRMDRDKRATNLPWRIFANSPNSKPNTNTAAHTNKLPKPSHSIPQRHNWIWPTITSCCYSAG